MKRFCYLALFTSLLVSCGRVPTRNRIDLNGTWEFSLDKDNKGIYQQWYLAALGDTIRLPGTTDSNQKGVLNTDTTTLHLNRVYRYEGAAWYRKTVIIPDEFSAQNIRLVLERTKPSMVWLDSTLIGSSLLLQSPQEYELPAGLTPGKHVITIRVDNDLKLTPYGNVHIYTDETQTNWNGIIGQIYLESVPAVHITDLQVYPDVQQKIANIGLGIANLTENDEIEVELKMELTIDGAATQLDTRRIRTRWEPGMQIEYILGDHCRLWDEHHQPLYRLTAVISHGATQDSRTVTFGMREFSKAGTRFTINGRPIFLRGKNDAAVFPLTGYTPTDTGSWLRLFETAQIYGINHYRFHSYCPPDAAFDAADQLGIYLQVELPFWGGLNSDSVADRLREEGLAMLKSYGNHPSFVMFSHGNEIWSGYDRVEQNILAFKEKDNRHLYTAGSNNGIGYAPPAKSSDYFVAARTPYAHDTVLTHTRLTQAFADSKEGGILNTRSPGTEVNFDYPVSQVPVPLVSHEIGQYQIYPDYREIGKYTGVLRARNLEVFRERLERAGMGSMDSLFQQASGAWSALCYKAEMEAALRTQGMAGFQLLDLQDFPGQGTALVGILDAFMESKGVIEPEAWRASCDKVVLLMEFPKYCWIRMEQFQASVLVSNYSDQSIREGVIWEMIRADGTLFDSGTLGGDELPAGELSLAGVITSDLYPLEEAEKLTLRCSIPGTAYNNSIPVWVYPGGSMSSSGNALPDLLPATYDAEFPAVRERGIRIINRLNREIMAQLRQGASVLLFPGEESVRDRSVEGLFPPDFWNYGMFKSISEQNHKQVSPGTLGLLISPGHPLFTTFPTDFHTNWQWFSMIRASRALILDDTDPAYRPIVQVIDNMERNHKMGMIFEFRVGEGKLLVCMSRLPEIMDRPEAVQLYRSILDYMGSAAFAPRYEPGDAMLLKLFGQ